MTKIKNIGIWFLSNMKFIGGMIIAITFINNWENIHKIEGKIELLSSHIESHQYLDIISRLNFLKLDKHGYPKNAEGWETLGEKSFRPLSFFIDRTFIEAKKANKISNDLGFILKNSVNDSVSFAFFHNQVTEYDKEYGKEMSRIEKKLKNDLEAQYDLHHIFYIIGFILMTFGEFKVKNSSKDTFNTSLLNMKY